MSMTREEAKEILENWNLCHYTPSREAAEAVISALNPLEIISALRSVSWEQVEKMLRGEWIDTNHRTSSCKCTKCGAVQEYETPFCPACGAPMTDEAVEIRLKELEALKNEEV